MTIDEMINHFEEVAKQRQERADALKNTTEFGSAECQKSADDCKQLAEWLKELKGYKKAYTEIDSKIECDYMGNNEYEKVLEQKSVLDNIKAEILDEAEYAYADFDRYKEDILHAEPDELPDDDFRYGLERAVEIINKYKNRK